MFVALGGGGVGDNTGFVASTYLRGVDFVQIPTTVLAMVDSSVGGKTAINLNAGKNLCGAFYQPIAVFADCETLETLPEETFNEGCAEIIKYGMILDADFLTFLKDNDIRENIEYVIKRCVEIKRDIVDRDEFEKGERKLLNFGHTIGHAIEKCSDYKISHGNAVAIGMVIATKGAFELGLSYEDFSDVLLPILEKNNLTPNEAIISNEGFAFAAKGDAALDLSGYKYILMHAFMSKGFKKFKTYSPITIKSTAGCAKKGSKKEDMINKLSEEHQDLHLFIHTVASHPELLKKKTAFINCVDDLTDAYWCLKTTVKKETLNCILSE
mgnify:CR=1 FL=1